MDVPVEFIHAALCLVFLTILAIAGEIAVSTVNHRR
jgi:hypothetical protein